MSERLIAIDWGTSNFRAFLVDRQSGECLESVRSDAGLRSLTTAEFPHYCEAQVGAWREGGKVPVYLSGMVGSARGWSEAPQLEVPRSALDLADNVVPAPGLDNAWIVPGLKVVRDDHVDVMRGEEIQAFGAFALKGLSSGVCCLPGTHSKWARLEGDRLVDFSTMMTGELYHAVRFHTLPGEPSRTADNSGDAFDADGFAQGLAAAEHPAGLMHALFEGRSRHLYAGLQASQVGSFLSGVLIGAEVLAQREHLIEQQAGVVLVGSSGLNPLYRQALERHAIAVDEVDSDSATLAGLIALAERHRLT
ncbi:MULTISPECIES: 2-dehydro-3-deoxygalactonokinase [Halomonas]|uniref:2-dehydro-3-deoxygalactonokinase n=1 Tax=Halomonas TaxID=2745 RepID=UPI001C985569|nr:MULTISPECIES: 2-dehydro-3-deoxygalactonokinase [Halomonas]MED5296395.1 2-dehydro-3-deoxygalactonokinase [Pseudomonadota bacterium]MBY5926281.1 2-dehydro-3-deoxygalactonokinase [Halomonas sp. DP4Y7-2]MBY5931320.1 2-dehydro-3-deoxygalactonokinase [Halomonas sp. DP8Y7-3]MBY5969216.1 2-dehydro-3-deoxygalactonokinase [Halomonas denitrificans]MBY6030860.1 2-dehydro-3-deoxygalactonokinase [Halomonas sp. DP8Y7-1]